MCSEFSVLVSFLVLLLTKNCDSFPWSRDTFSVTMTTRIISGPSEHVNDRSVDVISSPPRLFDLSGRNLSSLPGNLPEGIQWLSMRNNSIASVSGSQFQFLTGELLRLDLSHNRISSLLPLMKSGDWMTLNHLDLSHNVIHSLERRLFQNAPKLDHLNLSYNSITDIEGDCFIDLKVLTYLSLRNNRLLHLSSAVFNGLVSLTTIELDDNGMVDLADDLFAPLLSIEIVSVSNNQISSISNRSFVKSNRIRRIDFSFNKIRSVSGLTSTLTRLRPLTFVTFDGNRMERLVSRDFSSLSLSEISLRHLPNLFVIDEEAFYHLDNLEVLNLSDNPRLVYIHPVAIVKVDRLRVLDLHNCALMAISQSLVLTSPSLELLRISGNPLHCDCNARWITEFMVKWKDFSRNSTLRNLTFESEVLCESPAERRLLPLHRLKTLFQSELCRPVVIPLFGVNAIMEIGSSVTFSCRAIGLPFPSIHWILPSGDKINNTSGNGTRVRFEKDGSVIVHNLVPSDFGTYTCLASNPKGYDAASARLSIYAREVRILVKSISWNFVSVSWNGTDSTISSASYVILHRMESSQFDDPGGKIQLRPYMRAFTVANLYPGTIYEFCIGCEGLVTGRENETAGVEFGGRTLKKISCITVTTKDRPETVVGISNIMADRILAEVLCITTMLLTFGVVLVIVGKFRRRNSYREPRASRLEKESLQVEQPQRLATKRNTDKDLMNELLHLTPVTLTTSRTSLLESYDI